MITDETVIKFYALFDGMTGCAYGDDNSKLMEVLESLTPFECELFVFLIKEQPLTSAAILRWLEEASVRRWFEEREVKNYDRESCTHD